MLSYIDENYDKQINLRLLSEQLGYSYEYLSRVFSKSSGMSFTAYLNRYRILLSLGILKKTDKSITEIAAIIGFETLRSYNREFKKIIHMTPTEYRSSGWDFSIGSQILSDNT